MSADEMPMPGGRRSAAAALVCAVFLSALFVLDAHWVLLAAAIAGIGFAQVKLSQARQHAREAAARLVAVDVEQPAIAGKHAHRHRGTLDTIVDDSDSPGNETRLSQKALSEHQSRSPTNLGIPDFEKAITLGASVGGRARRRPETSHRILGDLESPVWSRPPSVRSERSTTSQVIIDDLQAQIQKLKEDRANNPSNPPSARSDRSVRSDTSQLIIDDLKAQILRLKEEKTQTPRSARSDRSAGSARSDTSLKIISGLQSEIGELREALKTVRQLGGPVGNSDDLKSLLRSLQLPEECDRMLEDEGVDFVEDLVDYTETELVNIGFKRGHAKRLLKAAASGGKDADDSPKRAMTAPAAG